MGITEARLEVVGRTSYFDGVAVAISLQRLDFVDQLLTPRPPYVKHRKISLVAPKTLQPGIAVAVRSLMQLSDTHRP